MNKFTLRAGGLSPVIIYVCILSFLLIGLLGNLSDWYKYGQFNWPVFSVFAGMMTVLIILFTWSFLLIRVEINDNVLFVKQVQKFVRKEVLSFLFLFPKNYTVHVAVKDIQSVFIGELGETEKLITTLNSERINNFFGYYHDTTMAMDPGSPLLRIPRWVMAKHMPIILIHTKNSYDSFIFSAKPFSRKGLIRFIHLLRSKGVEVTTEQYLNLEK